MKKIILLILFLLSYANGIFAQDLHYVALKINNPTGGVEIGKYNIQNCQDSLIQEDDFSIYTDLTFDAFENLYSFSLLGATSSNINSIHELHFSPVLWATIHEQLSEDITAMTCTSSGDIYAAGEGLVAWKTDGSTTNTFLGNFPLSMQAQGDMTYREGKLYLSSISNSLVEVDTLNPANSTVVFDFPTGTPQIHGLATVEIECDSFVTYASGLTATGSTIYIVDFDNETLIEVCQMERFIVGLASICECTIPVCDVSIDLDFNNSSGATQNNFESGIICVPPANISDSDVFVDSEIEFIDSIQIDLLNSNYPNEYFECQSFNNIIILGDGTNSLTLVNNGSATMSDFEDAVGNVLYYNDANVFLPTPVNIQLLGYSSGTVSDPAYSILNLGDTNINYDVTANPTSCFNVDDGEIFVAPTNGTAPYDFIWNNNQVSDSIYNLPLGGYLVTITDYNGCTGISDSIFVTQPDLLMSTIINNGSATICDTFGQLQAFGVGGTGVYAFEWNDGNENNLNEGILPGIYTVTVTDENGCQSSEYFILEEGISVSNSQQVSLCQGDEFELDGQSYFSDTTVCENFIFSNGCDSTQCFELIFVESIEVNFSDEICQGEVSIWDGNSLSSDTIIIETFTATNGCDSIVIFTLNVNIPSMVLFDLSGSLCNGGEVELSINNIGTYLWSTGETTSNILVEDEGIFKVTITDSNGCDITEEIEIQNNEIEVDYQLSDPSCQGLENGIIKIENVNGGTEPYLFSLDSLPFQQDFIFENLGNGNYILKIEDFNGCNNEYEISLNTTNTPNVQIQNYHEIKLGDSVQLQLMTDISTPNIIWEPSIFLSCDTCLNVTSKPNSSILYTITVIDTFGCFVNTQVEINVEETLNIYIPNAFTPNGDGVNEIFTIYGGSSISKVNHLRIFSRWGELVYEKSDFMLNSDSEGWNGKFKGEDIHEGVYVYALEVEQLNGVVHQISGELTLVR